MDEKTGIISWTPTNGGSFFFRIYGWTEDANFKYEGDLYEWSVDVPMCADLSKLYGTVINKDGSFLDSGSIDIRRIWISDTRHEGEIINGKYEINEIDAGEYNVNICSQIPGQGRKHEKSYKLTIGCGESRQLNINLAPPDTNYEIKFVSNPPLATTLGKEYRYVAKAQAKNADPKIKYKLINDPNVRPARGATFDENTGELRWTPDSLGRYKFTILAYTPDNDYDDELDEYQSWEAGVLMCDNPATLKIKINIDKNIVMAPYEAALYKFDPNDPKPYYSGDYYSAEVFLKKSDSVVIQYIDEGTYLLTLQGTCVHSGDFPVALEEFWYEDAYYEKDATPIDIACGETREITLNVLPKEPRYHKVSGRVTADDGSPIAGASVRLQWNNSAVNLPMYLWEGVVNASITNEQGLYEIWTRHATNIAIASPPIDSMAEYSYFFKELYYDQKSLIEEAENFKPSGSKENVNFVFPKYIKRNNSVTGKISYEGDLDTLNNIDVALYYVEPIDEYKHWKDFPFPAKTAEDGSYIIKGLMPGKYIAFASPRNGGNFIGGYYKDGEDLTEDWNLATRLEIGETSQIDNINLLFKKIKGVSGAGKITGFVSGEKKKQIIKLSGEDAGEQSPISGANVYAFDNNGAPSGFGRTNFSGQFQLSNLRPGDYTLKIDKVGYDMTSSSLNLTEKDSIVNAIITLQIKSIYEKPSLAGLKLSPNPASEKLRLDFQADGATRITLVNSLGEKVYSSELGPLSGASTHSIELGSLPQGAYYVIVESGKRASVLPVIIIK